jgi:hypothetical protein
VLSQPRSLAATSTGDFAFVGGIESVADEEIAMPVCVSVIVMLDGTGLGVTGPSVPPESVPTT